jgi:signal transduction histidine kinase
MAVERASKVVFALKNYARYDRSGKKQLIRVNEGLETVLTLYQNLLKRDIEVIRNYQPLPDILGYPDELIQVWTNLIHNAIQVMKEKGTLTITTYQQDDWIKVEITDSGDIVIFMKLRKVQRMLGKLLRSYRAKGSILLSLFLIGLCQE